MGFNAEQNQILKGLGIGSGGDADQIFKGKLSDVRTTGLKSNDDMQNSKGAKSGKSTIRSKDSKKSLQKLGFL